MAIEQVNIPATGSGDAGPIPVAVDDVSGTKYQVVKLDGGGDGVAVPIVAGQQIEAASIPVVLPAAQIATLTPSAAITGYSTAANQATEIASLASLDGKAPALGQALSAASVPVVLPAAQITTLTPPAAITGYATSANQTTELASLSSIDTKTPALGQALAAASTPVVLTAAQVSTLTPPAAITGYLTEADFDTKTGALTETAPATDTASSGLNGRLQRIAQRLSSLVTALGSPFQAGGSIGNTSFASTVADGANVTLGTKTDAKNTATDTTSVSVVSVLKQISASVQALVTNIGTLVFGAGTAAAAQRVTHASDDPAVTSLQLIDDSIFVDDAAFTVGSSKVTAAGIKATAFGSAPDAADDGDAVIPLANRHRIPFHLGGHPNVKSATYLWTASTTDDNVLAAISSGTKYAITRFTITMDEANTVGVAVRIGFGTANVPALPSANADAVDDILFYHPGMVPGSGASVGDGSGILGVGGDGAELRITAEATTGGTGVVTVTYFPIES